jgi:hypothetical protein
MIPTGIYDTHRDLLRKIPPNRIVPPMPDTIQFDRAEQPGTPSCSVCKRPLPDQYYVVNGHVVCENCRRGVEAEWTEGGAGRLGRAIALGVLATIACSVAWYLVLKLTGSEFGILAIVVGFVVGGAVRKGSKGRGGWRYQALAIFLTYTAIVSSYVPYMIDEARQQSAAVATDSTALTKDSAVATAKSSKANPLVLVVAIILGIGLLYALPFLAGLQNILGLVIIGIALFEAWKLNVRSELSVSGPHRVSTSSAPA